MDTRAQQSAVEEWMRHVSLRTPNTKVEVQRWNARDLYYHMGVTVRVTRHQPATPEEDSLIYARQEVVPPFIDTPEEFLRWLKNLLIRFEAELIEKHYLLVDGRPLT